MTSKQQGSDASRMAALFRSNVRSSGRFDVRTGRVRTEYAPLTEKDFEQHIAGKIGVGAVPIMDDDHCWWAALDIDNHDSDEDLPIAALDEKARVARLPLVMCRSKSGGVHAYLFLKKSMPAANVRTVMGKFAAILGHPTCEVFPKQSRLGVGKDGQRQFGNWINLPYLGGNDTIRYAVRDGKRLTLQEFLSLAESLRTDERELRGFAMTEHSEAPPCVQRMMVQGVPQGHRNEALYHITVYLRKAFPDSFETKGWEINSTVFSKPLPRGEAMRTINSAGKPDYGYRCNEEPMRSLCDRDTCLRRKFGITSADLDRMNAVESLPEFKDLVKYLSEPVRWEITIDGVKVTNISTEQLLEFRAMRMIIAERLTRVVPSLKPAEWERILGPLMKDARVIEAPDDASVSGVIRDRLREFAAKTDLRSRGENPEDRKALLRGMPIVYKVNGERCVVFRAQDFINYLKRMKSEELKGVNLWFAIKGIGVGHTKMRAGDENINVWYIPVKSVLSAMDIESPEFRSEL